MKNQLAQRFVTKLAQETHPAHELTDTVRTQTLCRQGQNSLRGNDTCWPLFPPRASRGKLKSSTVL